MVSDVLLLSYFDTIRLILTGEAGQALAYLYSEARLYKGARAASLSLSTTPRSTGNTSVCVKEVGHSNTRGTVRALFFPAQIYCCTIVYILNILWRLKVKSFKTPTVKKKLSSVLFILTANEHILTGSWLPKRGGNHYSCGDVSPVTHLLTMFIILPSSNECLAYLTLAPLL